MPTTYEACDKDVPAMAHAIMAKYYPDLLAAKVRITYKYAINQDKAPIVVHGHAVPSKFKIISYEKRVEGLDDAVLTLSKEWWDDHDEEEREALIDGWLYRLLLGTDDDGSVITDDCGRPQLKLRPADFLISGCDAIVKRHGFAAEECQAVLQTRGRWIQNGFEFGDHGDDRGAG